MTSLLLGALFLWAVPEGIPPDDATAGRPAAVVIDAGSETVAAPVEDKTTGYGSDESEGGTPEPLTLLLFGSGIVGLALSSRRARRAIQGH